MKAIEAFEELAEQYFLEVKDIDDFHELECFTSVRNALNRLDELEAKATPKKPSLEYPFDSIQPNFHCPSCGCMVFSDDNYCVDCGQALDWSEKE